MHSFSNAPIWVSLNEAKWVLARVANLSYDFNCRGARIILYRLPNLRRSPNSTGEARREFVVFSNVTLVSDLLVDVTIGMQSGCLALVDVIRHPPRLEASDSFSHEDYRCRLSAIDQITKPMVSIAPIRGSTSDAWT